MKIVNIKQLKEREFKLLEFEGEWLELFGKPERNFSLFCYGKEKSGKSTLISRFADYLARNFGKTLYYSAEEGLSETMKLKIMKFANHKNFFVGENISFEDMMSDKFKKKYFKYIVIDSLQYMDLTYSQYKQLRKKYPSKAFIFISQANGKGKPKDGTDIPHAVDIKVFVNDGTAKVQSRYAPEKTVQIFKKTTGQAAIFDN